MGKLYSVKINVADQTKEIAVYCDDVTCFEEEIDILTTSAFVNSYAPVPHTVFKALDDCGISVKRLAINPMLDLRNPCHVWLSKETFQCYPAIRRIGCIEFLDTPVFASDSFEDEQSMINSIRAYFHMLDLAAVYGVKMDTVALPLIGSGKQHISEKMLLIPLLNECISFLTRNHNVSRVYFIEKNAQKALRVAESLKNSLHLSEICTQPQKSIEKQEMAFISYSSMDKNIADNLCSKLERNGFKVWYAPRDVQGPYAEAIVTAIEKTRYFIVILSQNSIASEHVLNEIDLAFQNIAKGTKFKPLRIDNALFTPAFKYYLSRQHWMDASIPPLEERLNEFVAAVLDERTASHEDLHY